MFIRSVSCLRLSSPRRLVRLATWTLRERTSSQHWALGGFGGASLFLGFWAQVSARRSSATPIATKLKFTFAIFSSKALVSYSNRSCFWSSVLGSEAVGLSGRSLLEISDAPVELELLFDQRLAQALSCFLGETLLCLNILNIFLWVLPLSPRCAPLTVLTLSNLQGGGPFPIPPPTDPVCLSPSPNRTFTHSTEVLPTFFFSLSGVLSFWAVFFFSLEQELRKQSYCLSATC